MNFFDTLPYISNPIEEFKDFKKAKPRESLFVQYLARKK